MLMDKVKTNVAWHFNFHFSLPRNEVELKTRKILCARLCERDWGRLKMIWNQVSMRNYSSFKVYLKAFKKLSKILFKIIRKARKSSCKSFRWNSIKRDSFFSPSMTQFPNSPNSFSLNFHFASINNKLACEKLVKLVVCHTHPDCPQASQKTIKLHSRYLKIFPRAILQPWKTTRRSPTWNYSITRRKLW